MKFKNMLPEFNHDEINEVLINEDLANKSSVGATTDGGPRPPSICPPLITRRDWKDENPYSTS